MQNRIVKKLRQHFSEEGYHEMRPSLALVLLLHLTVGASSVDPIAHMS